MDREEEIKQIAYDFTTSKEDCKKLENRILFLFGVSQQRELLKVLGKHIAEQYDHNEEDVIEQLEWKVKTFNCG